MNWYLRLEKYLAGKGYKFLGAEGGLIFYQDANGRVLGASETSLAQKMR